MRISDWSSDVCSSDLAGAVDLAPGQAGKGARELALMRCQNRRRLPESRQGRRNRRRIEHQRLAAFERRRDIAVERRACRIDRRSEEHTSELQSLMRISYAVFCLKKKTQLQPNTCHTSCRQT